MNDQIENYELDMNNIPAHIAFIMDGNGRWAKKRMMPRTYGHNEGIINSSAVTNSYPCFSIISTICNAASSDSP